MILDCIFDKDNDAMCRHANTIGIWFLVGLFGV